MTRKAIATLILLLLTVLHLTAQTDSTGLAMPQKDSLLTAVAEALDSAVSQQAADVHLAFANDSAQTAGDSLAAASIVRKKEKKAPRDWTTWKPDPQRALWLALVVPGAGQIYNRKYWKLPIIYGGFMGCIYALTWNNMMYKDYSQAYLDITDSDPGTASYNKFLHLGTQITPQNEERYQQIFKNRKDRYRRWRDLSFFVMLGVYAISVIDAYVDAELSVFDISRDLSLKVEPAVIPNRSIGSGPLSAQSLGINCSLNF